MGTKKNPNLKVLSISREFSKAKTILEELELEYKNTSRYICEAIIEKYNREHGMDNTEVVQPIVKTMSLPPQTQIEQAVHEVAVTTETIVPTVESKKETVAEAEEPGTQTVKTKEEIEKEQNADDILAGFDM